MKVTAYWSWAPEAEGIRLRNHLTGDAAWAPVEILDTLEAIHAGERSDAAEPGHVERAVALGILFGDADAESAWLDRWERAAWRETPQVDQVELTNRCPYRCGYCPRTTRMSRPVGAMDLGLFRRVIEQVPVQQGLIGLHNFGESLTHPGIVEAVAMTAGRGLAPGLSANPPSLGPRLARSLVDAGLALLVLSLDTLDPDGYRALRGPVARFDRARRAIEAVVEARDRSGGSLHIVLQMIDLHANADDQAAFLDYCRDVGVDQGVVVRFGLWDTNIPEIAAHGTFTSPGYLPYCRRPWESLVVLWDGRVTPCCHDFDGAVTLGHAGETTFDAIWAGSAARRFREANGAYDLCRHCMFSRWTRDELRRRRGFRAFHRNVEAGARLLSWCREGREAAAERFSLFDVLTVPAEGGAA